MAAKKLRDKLYYSIAEVSEHLNVAQSLLRYWESEFKEIKPRRNAKGTRFYTKEDIDILEVIHQLVKVKGFTLQGAQQELARSKKHIQKKLKAIRKLEEVKGFLLDLREKL